MGEVDFPTNLVNVFSALTEIPLRYEEKADALKRIAELGMEARGSHACTLSFVNASERYLTQVACAGFDADYENRLKGKRVAFGSRKEACWIDYDLITRGKTLERYDLSSNGAGVANPHTAQRYQLCSVLCYPLKSDQKLIGYLNHFSNSSKRPQ